MKRLVSLLAAAGLVAALAPSPAAADAAGIPCRALMAPALRAGTAMEQLQLRTFHIQVSAPKKTYRRGSTAKLNVTVTRPAHEDPLGAGAPMDPPVGMPAEGVNVGAGVSMGDVFVFGHAVTNSAGKATVPLKIPSSAGKGVARADVLAWQRVVDTPCLIIEEQGYRHQPGIFKVR